MKFLPSRRFYFFLFLLSSLFTYAQPQGITWTKDGKGYYGMEEERIVKYVLPSFSTRVMVDLKTLAPAIRSQISEPHSIAVSEDENKVLLYTNAKKVWRYPTRGDYWIYNRASGTIRQLGKNRPPSSLMFAKLSPDGTKVAYVSDRNIYVEDLSTNMVKQLTATNGTKKLINGTFDWVYEEEFFCRDGFRWSPDSKSIAYWQLDASQTRDYYMLNTTDSIYSYVVPVEYPKAGQPPSRYRIGVINLASGATRWMNIPGDPTQTYLPRMEWAANSHQLIIQQLNRKQNESSLMLCNAATGCIADI